VTAITNARFWIPKETGLRSASNGCLETMILMA
jgi:hypothetical protein